MKHKLILSLVLIFTILLNACERENLTPKPPTYLKADLPEHSYHKENFPAPFLVMFLIYLL